MSILQGTPNQGGRGVNPLVSLMLQGTQALQQGYQLAGNRMTQNNNITAGFLRQAAAEQIQYEQNRLSREKMAQQQSQFEASYAQRERMQDKSLAAQERIAGLKASARGRTQGSGVDMAAAASLADQLFSTGPSFSEPPVSGSIDGGVLPSLGPPPEDIIQPTATPQEIETANEFRAQAPGMADLAGGDKTAVGRYLLGSAAGEYGPVDYRAPADPVSEVEEFRGGTPEQRDIAAREFPVSIAGDPMMHAFDNELKAYAIAGKSAFLSGNLSSGFYHARQHATLQRKRLEYIKTVQSESENVSTLRLANEAVTKNFRPYDAIVGKEGATNGDLFEYQTSPAGKSLDTFIALSPSEKDRFLGSKEIPDREVGGMLDTATGIVNRMETMRQTAMLAAKGSPNDDATKDTVATAADLIDRDETYKDFKRAKDLLQKNWDERMKNIKDLPTAQQNDAIRKSEVNVTYLNEKTKTAKDNAASAYRTIESMTNMKFDYNKLTKLAKSNPELSRAMDRWALHSAAAKESEAELRDARMKHVSLIGDVPELTSGSRTRAGVLGSLPEGQRRNARNKMFSLWGYEEDKADMSEYFNKVVVERALGGNVDAQAEILGGAFEEDGSDKLNEWKAELKKLIEDGNSPAAIRRHYEKKHGQILKGLRGYPSDLDSELDGYSSAVDALMQ